MRENQKSIFPTTPRLEAILNSLQNLHNFGVLADIGTDHGYLPIAAIRRGLFSRAIACDLNAGPLKVAEANICEAGLENKIETRLGDRSFYRCHQSYIVNTNHIRKLDGNDILMKNGDRIPMRKSGRDAIRAELTDLLSARLFENY